MDAEQLAEFFHETYERLAPEFDYRTRKKTRKPWIDLPLNVQNLMVAVCHEVLVELDAEKKSKTQAH
jgi:hypothetical protein